MAVTNAIDEYRPRARLDFARLPLRSWLRAMWTEATVRPVVATRQVFALTIGFSYFCGGVLGIAMLVLSRFQATNTPALATISVLCLLAGLGMVARGQFLDVALFHVTVTAGTLAIAVVVHLGNGGARSVALGGLWVFVSIGCFFLFAWSTALLHLAFLEICSVITFASVGTRESDVIVQQGCFVVVGLIVGWLTRAASTAERDALSGLPNRRGFDRRLAEAVEDSRRVGEPLSIVILDFDDFKAINDAQGHVAGDRLLRFVTRAWTPLVRPGQLLARVGGDEFAFILPGYSANLAAAMADRLRAMVLEESSCSAGVAELRDVDSQSKLVGRADVALYGAKSRGGDQTCQYGSSDTLIDDGSTASAILEGLALGEFDVYYQPIIDLRLGIVIGDEALVRWNHPTRGLVSPDDFIPQAESSGAIHALGQWILRQACVETAEYIRETGVPRRVSVNASGHELKSPDYAANVAAVLRETGLNPAALTIEVTESTFDADHPHVIRVLHTLRKLGVGIAIDDFGTGYSSLNRLDRLPANVLKIDRSFVAAIPASGADVPILRAIVALADALQLGIIAEGVETEHQAKVLTDLGCSHAQGFYFGRPSPRQQASVLAGSN